MAFLLFIFHEKIAKKLSLIDIPNEETSLHKNPTPLSGGLFISLYFFFTSFNFDDGYTLNTEYFFLFIITFIVNIFDDIFDFKAYLRIITLFVFTFIILLFNYEFNINQIHFSLFNKSITLSDVSMILIYSLSIIFLQMIYNLTDGINCLLTTYSLCLFIILGKLNYISWNFDFFLFLTLLGVTFYNFKNKLFLGSSGNSLLALFFALYLIDENTESFQNFSFELIFLMFGFLILDTLKLFIFRLLTKKNIFQKDKNHLHHKIYFKFGLISALLIYCFFGLLPFFVVYVGFISIYLGILILLTNYLIIQFIVR